MGIVEMRTECVIDIHDAEHWTDGRWTHQPADAPGAVTLDSRAVREGDLFVALKGAISDGQEFVADAASRGALAAVVSEIPASIDPHFPCLVVKDTMDALHRLASGYRDRFKGRVVALTGSVGKTTVKEMTAAILQIEGKTVFTAGNFNNITGVPLTVLRMWQPASYAVVEIGMSKPGEISLLVPLVRPHVAGVLNVRPVHMKNFSDLGQIAGAKREIFEGLEPGGVAVLNADDPLVKGMRPGPERECLYFGRTPRADLRLGREGSSDLHTQRFELLWRHEKLPIELRAPGLHNRYNAAAAAALALAAEVGSASIIKGLANYGPGMMRSKLWELSDGSVLLEDCYNSSPAAFSAALNALTHLPVPGRRVVVMGDMLELGDEAEEFHRNAGREAAAKDVNCLLGFGPLSAYAVEEFRRYAHGVVAESCTDMEVLKELFIQDHNPRDILLVKGSRGMSLERLTKYLLALWPPENQG